MLKVEKIKMPNLSCSIIAVFSINILCMRVRYICHMLDVSHSSFDVTYENTAKY